MESFISAVPCLCSETSRITVELQLDNIEGVNDVKLILESTFLDTDARLQLKTTVRKYDIQQISGHMLKFSERNTLYVKLNFVLLSKGFFITGNIDSIENIVLKLNYHIRFSYNKLMLHVIGKRISNNILYTFTYNMQH